MTGVVSEKPAAAFDVEAAVDAFHAEAMESTGLSDFGSNAYLGPMARVTKILGHPDLTDNGRAYLRSDLVALLKTRLIREAQWKKYAEYSERAIRRPIVICGVPRTGTTALHKLLSVDPQFQGLDHWLCSWPMPRPPRDKWHEEPGYRSAQVSLSDRGDALPDMKIVHEVVADEVDECLEVLRLEFVSNHFPSIDGAEEYDAWMQAQDERPAYRRLADTLRLVGLNDDRTWLLKNPGHLAQMEALLEVFPDARVIITHRDPVKSLGSLGSLLGAVRHMLFNRPDLTRIGPRELAYWGKAQTDTQAVRRTRPDHQFLDIYHKDFHTDPIATVRAIYQHFDLTFSPETETAMREWIAANPPAKHGEHRYALEDYGVTAEEVRAALGDG